MTSQQGRFKKNWKSGQADRFVGESPPSSLTTSICENFDPFLPFIKWQNNPKYGNLSIIFHIYLTASGEGAGGGCGLTQAVRLTAFSHFFFNPSLSFCSTFTQSALLQWSKCVNIGKIYTYFVSLCDF